jgi:manganese transport protein
MASSGSRTAQPSGWGPVRLMREMGPAWLASAIAAGPATMASVVTAGLIFGFPLFWVVVLSAVLGAFSVFLAMRLSLYSGKPLVQLVKDRLGGGWSWFLVANVLLAAGLAQLVILASVAGVSHTILPAIGAFTISPRMWGILFAVLLALGLATGGYRYAERAAKLLVGLVVLAFIAALFVVPWDPRQLVHVFTPSFPTGATGALAVAAVLGGAVHIALISMQGYTMRARGWDRSHYDLAKKDIFWSLGIAFGLYSAAIFLVTAAVLHGQALAPGPAHIQASFALEPLAGPLATWLFLAGLWGAAVTTLGANAFVPTYALSDRLGWGTTVKDTRFRGLLVVFALLSGFGVFLGGYFFELLRLVVAFGLLASPFVIMLVLVLLNDAGIVQNRPGAWVNLGGVALVLFTLIVGGNHAVSTIRAGAESMFETVVVVLVAVMALANLVALVLLCARGAGLIKNGSLAPAGAGSGDPDG